MPEMKLNQSRAKGNRHVLYNIVLTVGYVVEKTESFADLTHHIPVLVRFTKQRGFVVDNLIISQLRTRL